MEKKAAPLVAVDFDLPASDEFVTARADATLIERRPFPAPVGRAQDLETLFRGEMLLHARRNASALHPAIGRRDETSIIQILMKAGTKEDTGSDGSGLLITFGGWTK